MLLRLLQFKINKFWSRQTRYLYWSVKYLAPGILLIILMNDVVYEIFNPYGNYPPAAVILIGRGWLMYTLFAALIMAMLPWKKEIHSDAE